jgi:8-oxo-dGTP diphosphatase
MGRADQKLSNNRYQVVPRTLCFVIHGDDVLLLRGAPDKPIWPNKYNGVGGHIEAGEDVYSAARREIEEETGLAVHDLCLRGTINIPVDEASNTGILVFVFSATSATRDARPSKEGALEWVPRNRVTDFDLVEDLPIILPRVLAMEAADAPFHAHYHYDEDDRLVVAFSQRDNA